MASLVAISAQLAASSRKAQRIYHLDFPILHDAGKQVAAAFGVRYSLPDYLAALYASRKNDLPASNGDHSWTLPMPSRYMIAQAGKQCASASHSGRNWRSSKHSPASRGRYGQERRAIFQSTRDGQQARNCGATRKASSTSAHWKVQPACVRHAATANGNTRIKNGASATGAALYQRTRRKVTEPSSQPCPTRRGTMVNARGCAAVSSPTQKCASSWHTVPASAKTKKKACRADRKRISSASSKDGAR